MDFIQTYFIEPILQNGWFNPVNTIAYAVILVLCTWLVYKMLLKMKIKIDSRFFLAILPFIFWGSSTRVLHDSAVAGILVNTIYDAPLFVTPGSYIITFALALFVLLLSLLGQRFLGLGYWKTMFVIGVALCIWNVWILPIVSLFPLLIVLSVTGLWAAAFLSQGFLFKKGFSKMVSPKLLNYQNIGILTAHMLDATATVTAVTLFGYMEQHVVPRLLLPFLGGSSMFFLKVLVVLPVLWIIDRYAEEGNFKNFLKIVVLVLGLAPGLRDAIRLMVGV